MVVDDPITDMIEESGLSWLAKAMRGHAQIPDWLAKVLKDGPPPQLPLVLGAQVTITSDTGQEYGEYVMTHIRTQESLASMEGFGRPNIEIEFAYMATE